jgi:hypothetical protein
MKNFLVFLGIILMVFSLTVTIHSCKQKVEKQIEYPKYEYAMDNYLSDSAKIKMAFWITETVKATNNQMTGGDYEDPEDVIEQLEETGEKLFSVKIEGLRIKQNAGSYWEFIPKPELTKKQIQILDSLKNN